MPNKPLPPLNPQTHKPLNADDLSHIFNKECSKQELDVEHAWIDIPEDVREKYTYYRSTPLVRAYALEEALGTPAHIYFKNESTNPLGSHKSILPYHSAIIASKRVILMLPQRPVLVSGALLFRMLLNYTDWRLLYIRLRLLCSRSLIAPASCVPSEPL